MSERKDIDRAVSNVFRWCQKPKWAGWQDLICSRYVKPVADTFNKDPRQVYRDVHDLGLDPAFTGLVVETLLSETFGPEQINPVDDYLRYRASKETITGRNYLRALRDSEAHLWEVVNVSPGEWIEVREYFSGGSTIRVFERLGSKSFKQGDHFAARVITLGKKQILTSCALPIPPWTLEVVETSLQQDIDIPLLTHVGWAWLFSSLSDLLPELDNTEGAALPIFQV